jgi:hypothetical protein
MKEIIKKIQSLLEKQDSSTYKEIYNFNYDIEVDTDFMNTPVPPALEADETERKELIDEMVGICIAKGIDSRQCVIQKKYQDCVELAACLSTIQAISRNGKIDLHVFVRSQNFDNNFCYDNQTYMMIMCALLMQFPKNDFGKIYVHITSLHRFMKNGKKPWTILVNNFS